MNVAVAQEIGLQMSGCIYLANNRLVCGYVNRFLRSDSRACSCC